MFKIIKKDKNSKARLGVLRTPHGIVKTPSYVMVGTYGQIRNLSPADIKKTKTQLIIANTFHLWNHPRPFKFGKIPTMTDSGGFQVLSLAFGDKHKIGKFIGDDAKIDKNYKRKNIRITEKGVYFKYDKKWKFLGPELSIKIQKRIGADIIFAFDQITSPLDDYNYNKKAVIMTDKWARRCLKEFKNNKKQILYGIIQGGLFKDLRIKSAESIASMPFGGFGIGGSYTKKQISEILNWVIPHLPEENPRHLLGVGKIEDIFEAIENGIDTFDCVIPTREARHGRLYTKKGTLDIRRGYFSADNKIIEAGCKCPTCKAGVSRSKIRSLLKGVYPSQVDKGQRYALMHNMWFFNKLLEDIRDSIAKNRFGKFKEQILTRLNS